MLSGLQRLPHCGRPNVTAFLASDDAALITGHTLVVDAGLIMAGWGERLADDRRHVWKGEMRLTSALVAFTLCAGAAQSEARSGRPAGDGTASAPAAARPWRIRTLVPGSSFHTINGLALDGDGAVYAGSVAGEAIFRTRDFRHVETLVGPPLGQADDLVVTRDGSVIWTVIREGIVRRRDPDGTVRDIATGIAGVNPIALTPDGQRLFVGQMLYGDSLWEVDPQGRRPARKLIAGVGWLNGFTVGQDGWIYAPVYSKGEVARIDPDSSKVNILGTGFEHPTSVRIARDGSVLVLESATGIIWELRDGQRRRIAKLAAGLDNFVVRPDGQLLVSNMGNGSIVVVDPVGGSSKALISARLAFPSDIAVDGNRLVVADSFALRGVDRRTGAVSDILRPVVSGLYPATALSVAGDKAVLTSEMLGAVQIVDLKNTTLERTVLGAEGATDAIRTQDGRLFALLPAKGELVELADERQRVVARGLKAPAGLEDGRDGSVIVAESGSGSLLSINLADGKAYTIAGGLGTPRSVAIGRTGFAVLDVGGRKAWWVDRATGKARIIAHDLPVGHLRKPYPRSGGIAMDAAGTVYIAADETNAIYAISR